MTLDIELTDGEAFALLDHVQATLGWEHLGSPIRRTALVNLKSALQKMEDALKIEN